MNEWIDRWNKDISPVKSSWILPAREVFHLCFLTPRTNLYPRLSVLAIYWESKCAYLMELLTLSDRSLVVVLSPC